MSSLFVDRKDAHLEFDAGALVFRDHSAKGERLGTVPLASVSRIFLRGNLTLSASLLGKFGELGIGVVVLSGRLGKPSLLLGCAHHDARRRVAQTRLSLDTVFCLRFARQLIHAKLAAQHTWLGELCSRHPQARYALSHVMQQLHAYQQQLAQVSSLESLRGLEGAAASAYFAGLRAVVPASLGFHERNRRPPRDPFNALLSLTYTLVNAEMAIALHGAGFDPCVGYYHQLSWGRESLACDLVEPLRPLADSLSLQLVTQQTLTSEHFSISSCCCLLGKAGRTRYYSGYEENAQPIRQAIARSVQALRELVGPHDGAPEPQPDAQGADNTDDESNGDD